MTHLTDDELVLHYYGDAGPEAERLDAHLTVCAHCRTALERLGGVLALVEDTPIEEPGPGYERELWARLQDQLPPAVPWWRRLLGVTSGRLVLAGAAAAVILATFVAGWMARDTAVEPSSATNAALDDDRPTGSSGGVDRVLLLEAGEHLQRSQMALVELMNTGDGDFDVERGRARAADLVADNRLLRQSAALQRDDALDGVLEDLERILVEVANGPDRVSPDELRAWRERIASRGLLFRLRVLDNDMRLREQPGAAGPQKGPVS
jgi:hypothetical protein